MISSLSLKKSETNVHVYINVQEVPGITLIMHQKISAEVKPSINNIT